MIKEGGREQDTNERAELVKERKSTKLESHFGDGEGEGERVVLLSWGLWGNFAN